MEIRQEIDKWDFTNDSIILDIIGVAFTIRVVYIPFFFVKPKKYAVSEKKHRFAVVIPVCVLCCIWFPLYYGYFFIYNIVIGNFTPVTETATKLGLILAFAFVVAFILQALLDRARAQAAQSARQGAYARDNPVPVLYDNLCDSHHSRRFR